MTEINKKLTLDEFPPVATSAWEEKIIGDLKGGDYEKKLVWKSPEGIRIKPYYRTEDIREQGYTDCLPGEYPFVRGSKVENNLWLIRQDIQVENAASANHKATGMVEKGVTSLNFIFGKRMGPEQVPMDQLLKDIPLDRVEVNFSGFHCEKVILLLSSPIRQGRLNATVLKGSVNFDPLGRLCRKGHYAYDSESASLDILLQLVNDTENLPGFRTTGINALVFGNAGSTVIQELGFGLAMGAEYLSLTTGRGVEVCDAAKKMAFHFTVSSHYFMEIARYRAARLLWSKLLEAYDPSCREPMYIHAETTRWNLSQYDPYVNMLRTTTEGMSATLAGVDALTILPFNITFEQPDEFSERIARNQQIILREESYFDRVVDPAGGSYYIESFTESIAQESWNLFLEVQQQGGFVEALKKGFIQSQVSEMSRQRRLALATRRELMIGTNQYPGFREVYSVKPQDHAAECSCTCSDEQCNCGDDCSCSGETSHCDCGDGSCNCSCCNESARIVKPLNLCRGACEFEKLRLRADFRKPRPKVFMLTIGNLAMRLARSQFSCNFFACAGYEVLDNIGFDSVAAGIKAALDASADIVVLCSSDEEYAVMAPEAFKMLGNFAILVIAGAPSCMEELKSTGIENFIHIRSNMLETLTQFHVKLGIE